MFRKLGAFLIAPFPVALFQAIVIMLWPKPGKGVFENPVAMFITICLYFYIFGILIGFPTWLALRRRTSQLRACMLAAFFAAMLPISAALIFMGMRGQASAYMVLYDLLLFGCGGFGAGALFWRIGVRKMPIEDFEHTFS